MPFIFYRMMMMTMNRKMADAERRERNGKPNPTRTKAERRRNGRRMKVLTKAIMVVMTMMPATPIIIQREKVAERIARNQLRQKVKCFIHTILLYSII